MLTRLQGFQEICCSLRETKIPKQPNFKLYLGENVNQPCILKEFEG